MSEPLASRYVLADISETIDVTGYFGEYAADYDVEAVRGDIAMRLTLDAPDGLLVTAEGLVLGRENRRAAAEATDWLARCQAINIAEIAEKHAL